MLRNTIYVSSFGLLITVAVTLFGQTTGDTKSRWRPTERPIYSGFRQPIADRIQQVTPVHSPYHGWSTKRGDKLVRISPIRTLALGARTPLVTGCGDGTLILSPGSSVNGHQPICSTNWGATWRHVSCKVTELNTLDLGKGKLLMLDWLPKAIPGCPGQYSVVRTEFLEHGRLLAGPYVSRLYLPPNRFDPNLKQWLHGNLIRTRNGDLLSVMQGEESCGRKPLPFRCFLVRSRDCGKTWHYAGTIADWTHVGRLERLLTQNGLKIHGACEPCIAELEPNHLVTVMRTVDDESDIAHRQFVGPQDEFRDLNFTVRGDGVYPGVARLPKNKYYTPGPPSTPLLISHSFDGGRTWSFPQIMRQARGCFPRLSYNNGVLALTYGGLSALRWGNCITFSFDGGKTWTDEINYGPFFTSGYTNVAATGPNRFIAFFDCTAPQTWTRRESHWIGAVDVRLEEVRR